MSIQGVPTGGRSRAFQAFVAEIRSNPAFANNRAVKTWRLWDGTSATEEPTTDQMPAVQLRLIGGATRRLASTRHLGGAATTTSESLLTIAVELWTKGTNQCDAADLADLLHQAVFPQGDPQRGGMEGRLRAVGVADWQMTQEVLPASLDDYTKSSIHSIGTYQLVYQFYS